MTHAELAIMLTMWVIYLVGGFVGDQLNRRFPRRGR